MALDSEKHVNQVNAMQCFDAADGPRTIRFKAAKSPLYPSRGCDCIAREGVDDALNFGVVHAEEEILLWHIRHRPFWIFLTKDWLIRPISRLPSLNGKEVAYILLGAPLMIVDSIFLRQVHN